MECHRTIGQMVMPCYYGVDPSDVRKQTGTFGEAFGKLESLVEEKKLMSWRAALTEASNIKGFDLKGYR